MMRARFAYPAGSHPELVEGCERANAVCFDRLSMTAFFICLLYPLLSFAQQDSGRFVHEGLVRAMLTISPGSLPEKERSYTTFSTIYLHGNNEYYFNDNISVRSDGWYFLSAKRNNGEGYCKCSIYKFIYNHSVFAGTSLHFISQSHFDPYIALQPGVAISKVQYPNDPELQTDTLESRAAVSPLFSSSVGFNLYFPKIFHLFGEVQYIIGKHQSDAPAPYSLNELRFSFGLGWNLFVKKK